MLSFCFYDQVLSVFNTNPLEEDLKQACLFWNVIYPVLSLVGRFQVAYGKQQALPWSKPEQMHYVNSIVCYMGLSSISPENCFYIVQKKEEEKDLMPFSSLNQSRNISIWLDFKYLSQWNVKEIDQSCSFQEENCQCIRQFLAAVSRHPFISAERDPVVNPTWQPYQRGCHISVDVPDFLVFL